MAIGIGTIALAGTLLVGVAYDDVLAVSGVCKKKVGNYWRRTDETFESCKQLNQKVDGDNVFDPTGDYWWDVSG